MGAGIDSGSEVADWTSMHKMLELMCVPFDGNAWYFLIRISIFESARVLIVTRVKIPFGILGVPSQQYDRSELRSERSSDNVDAI